MPEPKTTLAVPHNRRGQQACGAGDAPHVSHTTPAKSPYDMTIGELQAEIGRLTMILHRKVCGDPRECVTFGPPKMEPNLRGSHIHDR